MILSSALYKNYYPLLVVATYVLAPLPNAICARCSNPDDFIDESTGSGFVDLGRFLTGFFVVMGIGELACVGKVGFGAAGTRSSTVEVMVGSWRGCGAPLNHQSLMDCANLLWQRSP